MPRKLPWAQAQDTIDLVGESPTRKRVKREPSHSRSTGPDSPQIVEVKRESFTNTSTDNTAGNFDDSDFAKSEDDSFKNDESSSATTHSMGQINPHQHTQANISPHNIERPTDGRTFMSKQLKLQKKAGALDARQQLVLQEAIPKNGKDDNDVEVIDNDEFAGTHFHQLMTTQKSVWSLSGLFGIKIKSSTRAAAGFGPPTPMVIDRNRIAVPRPTPMTETKGRHASIGEVTESSDDDDLDGKLYQVPTSTRAGESQAPKRNGEAPKLQARHMDNHATKDSSTPLADQPKRSPGQQSQKPTVGFKSKMQALFDDLDELPESSRSNTSLSDKKEHCSPTSIKLEHDSAANKLESKKSRSHNVPTFLL